MFQVRQAQLTRTALAAVTLTTALVFTAGCTRDPNVRKQKYLESGKRYEASGKYKEAGIQFSNALKVDKNYADAYLELGKVDLKLGLPLPAYSALEKAVELAPGNQSARITLGQLLLAGNAPDRAAEQAKAVIALNSNNADAYSLLAGVAQTKGDNAEALKQIQHALSIDPNRGEFHSALALLQANAQDFGSAQQELEKAISLDPKNVTPHLVLAGILQKKGDTAGAQQQLQMAIAASPQNVQAHAELAGLYYRAGDSAKAEQTLQQSVEANPDDPMASALLANFYTQTRQLDHAVSVFAGYDSKYSKSEPVRLIYADLLYQKRDYGKSSEVISELLKKDPANADIQALNAQLLVTTGKTDDALDALKKAVKQNPGAIKTQMLLAQIAGSKGDLSTAESALRAAAQIDPSNIDAATGLASVAVKKNDAAGLQDVADRTIKLHPNLPNGYLWRGTAEAGRKEYDKAAADFQTVLQKDPNNSTAYLELGQLQIAQGHATEGQSMVAKALDKNPGSARALAILVYYDMQAKQPAKAIARIQAQIAKAPNNADLYVELAQVQFATKDFKGSLENARKAMQMNPTSPGPLQMFVEDEVALGEIDSALSSQQAWVNAHTSDSAGYRILGTLQEAKGNTSAATESYKKTLQLDPNDVVANNNLAYMMVESGQNVDVALNLAQAARRNAPDAPATADTLAWVYYYKQSYSAARDLLESASQAAPTDADIQFHLGMVYSKLNDKTNAQLHLKKAVSLAPGSKASKNASAALAALG